MVVLGFCNRSPNRIYNIIDINSSNYREVNMTRLPLPQDSFTQDELDRFDVTYAT